jgi:hypothetical protein
MWASDFVCQLCAARLHWAHIGPLQSLGQAIFTEQGGPMKRSLAEKPTEVQVGTSIDQGVNYRDFSSLWQRALQTMSEMKCSGWVKHGFLSPQQMSSLARDESSVRSRRSATASPFRIGLLTSMRLSLSANVLSLSSV